MFIPSAFHNRPYAERHFKAIAEWARCNHPFYQSRIGERDEVPIIDRATVVEHNQALLNGHPVTVTTSGSTGMPVRLSQSPERIKLSSQAEAEFVRLLGGRLPRVRIVHPWQGEYADDLLDIEAPLEKQLAFIQQRYCEAGAVAITTYPTNAEQLARAVVEQQLDMRHIRRFGVFAETFEPHQEALVREAFPNAQIWATYSAMEFGLIAGRCPYEPEFHHINAKLLGVEVLNEVGEPCIDGERGRVVITDYFNRRSPFIRYEIGDYAQQATCPCGRSPFPSLGKIYGKVRGSLLRRDGQRVIFTGLSVALRDLPGLRQYQVIQHSQEAFTAKLVAVRPDLDTEVRSAFEQEFGYIPDNLRVEYVDEIPRGVNGKFHASICEC